jgi:hypothetical protein
MSFEMLFYRFWNFFTIRINLFFLHLDFNNSPVNNPISCPGEASGDDVSHAQSQFFSIAVKLFSTVLETNLNTVKELASG